MTVVREFPILRTRRRVTDQNAREVAEATAALLRALTDVPETERRRLWQFLSTTAKAATDAQLPAVADAINALGQAAIIAVSFPEGARKVADRLSPPKNDQVASRATATGSSAP